MANKACDAMNEGMKFVFAFEEAIGKESIVIKANFSMSL